MKKIGEITVNDGKGLYDNEGLCDSLLMDLNRLPKLLIDNQFIAFGSLIAQMGQKVQNLKNGIRADMDAKDRQIAELKQLADKQTEHITGLPGEKEDEHGAD